MPTVLESLQEKFGADAVKAESFRDNQRAMVSVEHIFDVLKFLKEEQGFDLLSDMTCVDYLTYPNATDRYGIIYVLTNIAKNERLIVKTFVNDPEPTVPSVYSLWKGCNWMEREVYDLYGIRFTGHPDLRRILLPEGYVSHPLRKDYPLRGKGERHNFPTITRAES